MGRLFKTVQSEMLETRLNERLWGLFVELLNLIELVFDGIDAEELFERLFNHEKACQRIMAFLEISGDIDYKT
jgi:thymidine phosphorylase